MPPAQKKTRRPKASTYTFTGCWTCRRRHIKCDEGKPSCNRCTKAGFECQGYDFRFAGIDSSRTFRRPVSQSSAASRTPALSAAKVNQYLDHLDTATKTTYQGPFSVLAFDAEDTAEDSTAHPLLKSVDDDVQSASNACGQSSQDGLITPPAEATDLAVVHSPSGHVSPIHRGLRPMSISTKQGELFEYWSRSLCLHLSPLSDSSANPFRYLYPSLALEGLTVDPGLGGARLAVFHGMCGTAAWSLSKLKPDDQSYRTLSVKHDQLALQYIQQTIEKPGGIRDSAIPAAIMACLTGDIVSGRLNSWGRHLRGGFRCMLNVLAQQKTSDSTTSSLCQQYLLGAAFGNFGTPSEVHLLQGGILNEALYIEECHGITQSLLIAITATNHLAVSGKRQNPAAVDGVRAQLLRSYPRMTGRLRQPLAKVYWYAAMIHFTRAVLRSDETGDLVNMAIDSLERAQEAGEGNPGRIMMWPLLKIGPECNTKDLRVRLSAWCESQLGVRNIKTFLENLSSTWTLSELPIASDTANMFQAQMEHG